MQALRRLGRVRFDKTLNYRKKRRGHESRSDSPLYIEAGSQSLRIFLPQRERLPYALFEALPQYSWAAPGACSHQSSVNPRRRLHMREEGGRIQRARIARLGYQHGRDDLHKLRSQQIVFRRIVGIKSGTPDTGFSRNVADADVAVSAPMKQLDKCSINVLARSGYAQVRLAPISIHIRDTCRFVFRKCHGSAFSVVRQRSPL